MKPAPAIAPALALGAALFLLLAAPAGAEIAGGCRVSINGTDVGAISSADPAQAIHVAQGGQATVVLESPSPITELHIFLEFAGQRIPAVQRPVNGTTVRETVPVDKYLRNEKGAGGAVGLYKVIGEGRGGGTCAGSALILVEGNPLQTIAGVAGAFGGPRGLGWRPKLSGLGLLGGLLAGAGGLVLGQQYGVVYPTAPAVI